MTWKETSGLYRKFVNPDYVDLLEAFNYGRSFVRAKGTELYDDDGNKYLDFLAGFGVHNLGHNPAAVMEALQKALASDGPSMLNIDAPVAAGQLAECLTHVTHPRLCRTIFASSGAESVEIAIRAVRAATGRVPIVACHKGYHGFTTGAMSLMGDDKLKAPFGPLLPDIAGIPFGNTDALREICRSKQPAAFFVEPIQAEGGVVIPDPKYLSDAYRICHENGCLLVVDEIQTGLGRTGKLFATKFEEVVPDMLLIGKALSAGLIPVSATMMTADVWKRAFSGPERCLLDSSTCSGGLLAMTAGLAAVNLIKETNLAENALKQGQYLVEGLKRLAKKHAVMKDVRGSGLLIGIEFQEPSGLLIKAAPEWSREGLYTYVIAAKLLRDHRIVAQPCSLARNVLRMEPPLVVNAREIDCLIKALDETISACPSHNSATFAAFRKTFLGGQL